MILDKALLLKGLVGTVALAGTGTTAVLGFSYLNTDSPESLIENSGLSCTFNSGSNTNEGSCTAVAENKKINVKHDNSTKKEGITSIDVSGSKKIKIQKETTEGSYNGKVKLTIEGGDITLTNGATTGTPTITKLEEFETYEIVKELFGKYYLSRKSTALEGKSKALGLPTEGSACILPSTGTITCQLDEAKLKKINFDGKDSDGASIATNGTVTLTITKVDNSDSIFGTGGYKFAFQSEKDITISSSNKIKKNTNTEFKVKETTSTDGGAKTLSLEKAWDIGKWGQKIGLTCSVNNGNKECSLPSSNSLNLYIDNTKTEEATISEDSRSKKLKYEEDVEGHNQGFKFYIDSTEQEISLTSGSATKKIENNGATYEIKEEDGKWYLAKKTTGGGN